MATSDHTRNPTHPLLPYTSACFCKRIQLHIRRQDPLITGGGRCTCSYCVKKGILWGWCRTEDVEILEGKEELKGYRFGEGVEGDHLFCGTCSTFMIRARSISTFPKDEPDVIAYNLATFTSLDIFSIPILGTLEASKTPPLYTPATPIPASEHGLVPGEGEVIMHGSCHCKAVRYAVVTRPLNLAGKPVEEGGVKIMDCNCSFCASVGATWIYPTIPQFYITPSPSSAIPTSSSPTTSTLSTSPSQSLAIHTTPTGNNLYTCPHCACAIYDHRPPASSIGLNARLLDIEELEEDRGDCTRGVLREVVARAGKLDARSW